MTLDWTVVWDHRERFLEGAVMTMALTVLTMAIAVPGGLILAGLRMSSVRLVSGAATAFVEFFRATPLILQIYWAFYVLPVTFNLRLSEFATGLLGLSLNVSAFNSETFRAGILSIRTGQWNAGLALGMSRWHVFSRHRPAAGCDPRPAGAGEHLGFIVQGHLARLHHRHCRAFLCVAPASRPDLPLSRDPDGDGRNLLAHGLSAGQARRLDPPQLKVEE